MADEPIFEPRADWLPLELAPLHYVADYAPSARDWADQLRMLVDLGVNFCGLQNEYRFETAGERDRKWAWTHAFGMVLVFDAHECTMCLDAMNHGAYIYGHPDEFFEDDDWSKLSEVQSNWFKQLVRFVIGRMHAAFERSVRTGASQIMARKNTVLAPFEPVHFDQWRYFCVDDPLCAAADARKWIDPLYGPQNSSSPRMGSSASGPQGEKLFSIHIAPGLNSPDANHSSLEAERRCSDYLVRAMEQSPEGSPHGTISETFKACQAMFPGLSEHGFRYCLRSSRNRIGDSKRWAKPGPKPATKSRQPSNRPRNEFS